MILENLKKRALEMAAERIVTDVRIGLCYTAVRLDDQSAGVAFTFLEDLTGSCASPQRTFAGSRATRLLEGVVSEDPAERTVGVATANALLNREKPGLVEGDILDLLVPGQDDVVGMVGYFGPVIARLQGCVKELRVFERRPEAARGALPEAQAPDFLRSCSLALITATSIINRTAESLLEAAKGCRRVALVGASTPLLRTVFSGFRVDCLAGVVITDPAALLRTVSEGGGMRGFKGYIKKMNSISGETSDERQ